MAEVTITWYVRSPRTTVDIGELIHEHPKVLAKTKPGTPVERLEEFLNELIESGAIDPIDDFYDYEAERFLGINEAALEHALLLAHREPTGLEIAAHALGVELPPAPPQTPLFGA